MAVVLFLLVRRGLLLDGGCPALAVVACCMAGGDADTTAAMCGALVGALHGAGGGVLPAEWAGELEARGREAAGRLGRGLAALDCGQQAAAA